MEASKRRAPKLFATVAAQLQRALRAAAGSKPTIGMRGVIATMLIGGEVGEQYMHELRATVEPAVYDAWEAVIRFHQEDAASCEQSAANHQQRRQACVNRADAIVDQIGKRAKVGSADATGIEQAGSSSVLEADSKGRPAAVGSYRSNFPDLPDPRTQVKPDDRRIVEWTVPTKQMMTPIRELLPRRATRYVPVDEQGRLQLSKVKEMKLWRVRSEGEEAVFTIGALLEATRHVEGLPSKAVLERVVQREACPTLLASQTGHQWSLTDMAPMDGRQCAAIMQATWAVPPLEAMQHAGRFTESQLRSMWGQATAGGAVDLVMDRLFERVKSTTWRHDVPLQVAGLGAGMAVTTMQIVRRLGPGVRVGWLAEGCPIVGPVGYDLTRHFGHEPQMLQEAHDPQLAHRRYRQLMEAWTLNCAPFCLRGGLGVEAALRELRFIRESLSARRSRAVVMETTAHLWLQPSLRARVEAILQRDGMYAWESMRVSPDVHCGVGNSRDRAFYVGILSAHSNEEPRHDEMKTTEVATEEASNEGDRTASEAEARRQTVNAGCWTDEGASRPVESTRAKRAHEVEGRRRRRKRRDSPHLCTMTTIPAYEGPWEGGRNDEEREDRQVPSAELEDEYRRMRKARRGKTVGGREIFNEGRGAISELVEARPSTIHGLGLFAKKQLRVGASLGHVKGEVLGEYGTIQELLTAHPKKRYLLTARRAVNVAGHVAVDAETIDDGNEIKFMNSHVGTRVRVPHVRFTATLEVIVMRLVRRGEEILVDYGETYVASAPPQGSEA